MREKAKVGYAKDYDQASEMEYFDQGLLAGKDVGFEGDASDCTRENRQSLSKCPGIVLLLFWADKSGGKSSCWTAIQVHRLARLAYS